LATILPAFRRTSTGSFFHILAILNYVKSIYGFSGVINGFFFHFMAFFFRLWLIIRFLPKERIINDCIYMNYTSHFHGYSFTRNPHSQPFLSLFFHFWRFYSFVFGFSTPFHGFSGGVYG